MLDSNELDKKDVAVICSVPFNPLNGITVVVAISMYTHLKASYAVINILSLVFIIYIRTQDALIISTAFTITIQTH